MFLDVWFIGFGVVTMAILHHASTEEHDPYGHYAGWQLIVVGVSFMFWPLIAVVSIWEDFAELYVSGK